MLKARRGGAGPTDHKALTIDGLTVRFLFTQQLRIQSPFVADAPDEKGFTNITRKEDFFQVQFPHKAKFLDLSTAEGSNGILHNGALQGCFSHNRFTDLYTIQIKAQN